MTREAEITTPLHDTLLDQWRTLWRDLCLPAPACGVHLVGEYGSDRRAYHTLQHLQDVLAIARERAAPHGQAAVCLVQLALWFHDAIYDPQRQDNEARSAAWAVQELRMAGLPVREVDLVEEAILSTAGHDTAELSLVAQLVVDADLSILAAPPARFDQYEGQVRIEYRHVPEHMFRSARREILRGFLARPRIYVTAEFADLEMAARANLRRSMSNLATPLPPGA